MMKWMKKFFGSDRVLILLLLCVSIPSLFAIINYRWEGSGWRYIIHSDGKGYYAYLPAVFIYGDLDFKFVESYEENYYDPGNFVKFTSPINDKLVNKYWLGTSLMMLPFFFTADFLAPILHYPDDGYSFPYQAAVSIATLCWLTIGTWALYLLLRDHFKCNRSVSFIGILAIVFGTNLFYYTIGEPSMSHVYSFSALSLFLFNFSGFIRLNSLSSLWLAAFWAGIILLIRPTNFVLLFSMLILFKDFEALKAFWVANFKYPVFILSAGVIVLSIVGLQLYYFKRVTGSWWVDTYVNENFNFLKPELFNFLLSYRKGLWVYSPLTFIALLCAFDRIRNFPFRAITSILLLLLYYFILSSWWMWYYGGSFGMRAAIDAYPILVILLVGFLNNRISLLSKFSVLLVILFCISLNLVQTYQYTHWILPWDNMNKEKYWKIFFRTSRDYVGVASPND